MHNAILRTILNYPMKQLKCAYKFKSDDDQGTDCELWFDNICIICWI